MSASNLPSVIPSLNRHATGIQNTLPPLVGGWGYLTNPMVRLAPGDYNLVGAYGCRIAAFDKGWKHVMQPILNFVK